MLTPMAKIEQVHKLLLADALKVQARIKEIGRVFSLMALVDQQGPHIKLQKLEDCMKTLGVQNTGGADVDNLLQATGSALRSKMDIVRRLLRREHRRLRKGLQVAQRNARALRKIAKSYVYRPGMVDV